MLIYEKKVDGVNHLYGTLSNIHSDEDKQLVYRDRDGNDLEIQPKDSYVDATQYQIKRRSDDNFVDVFIDDTESGELVNVIPGSIDPQPAKVVTKIEITSQPTKTEYALGEKLNLGGIEITATYEDGTTSKISSGYTSEPANGTVLNTEGTVTVTITYKEQTSSFDVTVEDKNKVIMYQKQIDEIPPVSLDEYDQIRVNKTQIESEKKYDFELQSDVLSYASFAFPEEFGYLTSIIPGESGIESISGFDTEVIDGQIVYYSRSQTKPVDPMIYHCKW